MPRGRAKLSEKEERIMVQAQLMGLNTESMIRIGNRLRALDKEREFRQRVAEVTEKYTWTKKDRENFIVRNKDGLQWDVNITYSSGPYGWCDIITATITKPGTKMKPRTVQIKRYSKSSDEIAWVCPEGSKNLFRILDSIYHGKLQ